MYSIILEKNSLKKYHPRHPQVYCISLHPSKKKKIGIKKQLVNKIRETKGAGGHHRLFSLSSYSAGNNKPRCLRDSIVLSRWSTRTRVGGTIIRGKMYTTVAGVTHFRKPCTSEP